VNDVHKANEDVKRKKLYIFPLLKVHMEKAILNNELMLHG
jgi:hypothetical protein